MKRLLTAVFVMIGLSVMAQKNTIASQLTRANVYYGYGAELTHTVKISLQNNVQEVTIGNISNALDQNTIQVSVPENVVLMSYRFNARTIVENQANPVVKKTEDSLKVLQKQIAGVANEAAITAELLDKTSKLIEAYSAGGNKNLSTADLIKLLDFYAGKVQAYRTNLYALQSKQQELTEEYTAMNTRLYYVRQENGGNASKVTGEIILQLMAPQATLADIGISYFTSSAGWIPTYDIRVKSIDNSLRLSYKASVNQRTGIDWKQVKLTLSTSNPNQGNTYPSLNPLYIQMYNPEVFNQMRTRGAAANYNRAQAMSTTQVDEVVVRGYASEKKAAAEIGVENYLTLNESQLNTSFEIDLPYDIPGDGKSYSVAIKDEPVKATYKHYAIPKLDKDAFLLAEISDWESLDLLPGDANIIMDNVYLGKSFIDPNTTADTLNLSLGRDKRLAVKRLLVKDFSKSKIKGDNKTETFTYEITVKNNKNKEVSLLLKDQFPVSNTKEIVVKLEDDGGAEINEELGTLNWKTSLKAGESKKFRFSYSVTYPKDKRVTNLR